MVTLGAKEGAFLLYQTQDVVVNDEDVGVLAESLHLVIDQWIQYELGKQYLCYTTLGIEPRTYSYSGRISYHNCVCWFKTRPRSPWHVGPLWDLTIGP